MLAGEFRLGSTSIEITSRSPELLVNEEIHGITVRGAKNHSKNEIIGKNHGLFMSTTDFHVVFMDSS